MMDKAEMCPNKCGPLTILKKPLFVPLPDDIEEIVLDATILQMALDTKSEELLQYTFITKVCPVCGFYECFHSNSADGDKTKSPEVKR